jgi:hypothetical protein
VLIYTDAGGMMGAEVNPRGVVVQLPKMCTNLARQSRHPPCVRLSVLTTADLAGVPSIHRSARVGTSLSSQARHLSFGPLTRFALSSGTGLLLGSQARHISLGLALT